MAGIHNYSIMPVPVQTENHTYSYLDILLFSLYIFIACTVGTGILAVQFRGFREPVLRRFIPGKRAKSACLQSGHTHI